MKRMLKLLIVISILSGTIPILAQNFEGKIESKTINVGPAVFQEALMTKYGDETMDLFDKA